MFFSNMAYFNGPWFVRPAEMPPQIDNRFYPQESFLSTISDTNPLLSIVGKCSVLELNDYRKSRPTQYSEADVFVCEAVYDESKRMVKGQLPEGLKQFEHSENVVTEEIYFVKNPVTIQKVSNFCELYIDLYCNSSYHLGNCYNDQSFNEQFLYKAKLNGH